MAMMIVNLWVDTPDQEWEIQDVVQGCKELEMVVNQTVHVLVRDGGGRSDSREVVIAELEESLT